MKVSAILAAALTTAQAVYAVDVQKSVIVTYDEGTPDNIVRQAMDAIKSAGGIVTHEYKLIKAFAAKAPEKVLETVQAWGNKYNAVIEEDQVVTINTNN